AGARVEPRASTGGAEEGSASPGSVEGDSTKSSGPPRRLAWSAARGTLLSLRGLARFGLGAPRDAFRAAGPGIGLEHRFRRGMTVSADLDYGVDAIEGLALHRLRVALGGGYTLSGQLRGGGPSLRSRSVFELAAVVAGSIEPWWPVVGGSVRGATTLDGASVRGPMLGVLLRFEPRWRLDRSPRLAVVLGIPV